MGGPIVQKDTPLPLGRSGSSHQRSIFLLMHRRSLFSVWPRQILDWAASIYVLRALSRLLGVAPSSRTLDLLSVIASSPAVSRAPLAGGA